MKTELINIKDIKLNPKNPRIIRDDKFKKLVKSIEEFPQMLRVRPIVVDEDYIVLGGNMRLKAAIEAGLQELEVIKFEGTEEQKKQFLIKDNVSFGEWDYLLIHSEEQLNEWGMDLPNWNIDVEDGNDFFNNTEDLGEADYELTDEEDRSDFNGTYLQLNLEMEDYIWLKKIEKDFIEKTGMSNLSDAFGKVVKENI